MATQATRDSRGCSQTCEAVRGWWARTLFRPATSGHDEEDEAGGAGEAAAHAPLSRGRHDLAISGALFLLYSAGQLALPVTVKWLLDWSMDAESARKNEARGFALAALAVCASFLGNLAKAHAMHRVASLHALRRSDQLRAIYASVFAKRALDQRSLLADAVQLINIESSRALEYPLAIHVLWSAPLTVAAAFALMAAEVGLAVLATLSTILLFFPLVAINSARVMRAHGAFTAAFEKRVSIAAALASKLRALRFMGWEAHLRQLVATARQDEVARARDSLSRRASNFALFTMAPFFASVATFACHLALGGELSVANAFAVLSLIYLLRFPLTFLPAAISNRAQTAVAERSIAAFVQNDMPPAVVRDANGDALLELPALSALVPLSARDASSDVGAVRLRGVSVCWGEKQALADCSVEAAPGELVFVLGAVGAGKSSLIQALAGTSTLRRNSERAETLLPSRVSLASQKPFLASGTVRENICFGLPFDEARYRAVLHACALEQDLAAWRLGDATLVSNNGENVSGGQRQRIAIARACYDNVSRCVVLDDPLSALDAATARHVLERCICGLLRGRTVIVASHAVSSARCADKVWFVDQGARAVCGTFDELMLALPAFRAFVSEHERGNSRESEAASAAMRGEEDGDDDAAGAKGGSGEERGNEPAPPRRDSFTTILLGYFRAARSSSLLACLFALFLFLQVLDFWGAAWLGLASSGTVSVGWGTFSGVYFGSVLLSALVLRLRSSAMATFCQRASATLYAAVMGSSRLQHGMPKHEAAEARELLAKDMQEVDLALPLLLENSAASFFAVLGIVCVTIAVTPFGVLAVAAALWALRAIHLTYSRVQRRLFFSERAARQDLATLVADTVLGRETVLSFGRRAYFERLFGEHVERLEALAAAGATTESWLHVRLSAISSAILCCGCVVLFLGTRGVLSYNRVSIAISFAYSITFTYYLAWLYKLGTLLHTKLFSVQMLNDFARDASQKRQDGDKKPLVSVQVDDVGAGGGPKPPAPSPPAAPLPHQPQPPTPKHDGGKARDLGVSFEDVWFAHREGSPMVLRGLSLACGYGERVALVGRSGAGKSSVLSCLAGMGVRVAGSVRVNGQELRARGAAGSVCFVPQETCIFSASVRFNLDPSGRASEAALWAALKATGLHASFASLDDHVLSEDAAVADASAKRPARVVVLSEGQKALLALTRAYLSGCRVLCLDEVCANVDTATALRVSELLRTLWSHAAVLSVAHRVDAVRGCTRFVALRNGRVAREGALAEPKQAHSQ